MKRYILALIMFFSLVPAFSQEPLIEIFDSYNLDYCYEWRGLSLFSYSETKDTFVNYVKEHNLLIPEREYEERINGVLSSNLYVFDINGDGFLDVLYSGSDGNEKDLFKFFLKEGNDYFPIFTGKQSIVKAYWKERRLVRILTHDWGCCGSFRLVNSAYDISYNDNGKPKFTKVFQSAELHFITKPLSYFEEPLDFVTKNENDKLRISPIIDDTSYFYSDFSSSSPGNVICMLPEGTKGTAYGNSFDNTGREWWYVLIEPNTNVKKNKLYLNDLDFPTSIVGWLSSRYVLKIS